MGTKFYTETESGGTVFHTERKIGDVRIPNYVYDIWLPVLGAQALGVYAVYCRLERQGAVKSITQATLARACRMGTGKLSAINEQLEDCGFIRIKKPTGQARLMHWTTEITVLDAPQEVSKEMKGKYALKNGEGYEVLTPWLEAESPENPTRFSAEPAQVVPENPDRDSNIAPLDILHPLEVEKKSPPERKPDILDAIVRFQGIPGESWTVPAAAGGADDWQPAVDAFADLVGLDPDAVPKGTRKEWSRQLQEVGREWRGGPMLLAEVIEQVPESQFHWKTYSSPHGAKADLGVLIGQHRNGGIRKQESSSNGSAVGQIAAIRKKMAQQQSRDAPVDAEFRVMKGEVL